MQIINDFFGMILNFIFEGISTAIPTYTLGISIIIFTLVAQLLLTPLKLKQQRTTRAMSRVQPELQKLQKRYKDKKDQQSQMAYTTEMQALYKKHKISPLSGCLPMLIQFPLIIALYNVLRQPSMYISKLGTIYTSIAETVMNKVANYQGLIENTISGVSQGGAVKYDLGSITQTPNGLGLPQFLSQLNTQQWQEFLMKMPTDIQDSLNSILQQKHSYELFLGVNLVDSPAQLFKSGIWLAIIIPIIAGASTFIFSKITMASSSAMQQSAGGDGAGQTESMMKVMNIMMPIMTGMFSWSVPSGLALYWISGNIIMMVQQIWVNKIAAQQEMKLAEQFKEEKKSNTSVKKKVAQQGQEKQTLKKRPEGGQVGERRLPPKKRPEGVDVKSNVAPRKTATVEVSQSGDESEAKKQD